MRQLKKEFWPHMISFDKAESSMKIYYIEEWLKENIGPKRQRWNMVCHYDGTDVYFKQGKDATMFLLRWS